MPTKFLDFLKIIKQKNQYPLYLIFLDRQEKKLRYPNLGNIGDEKSMVSSGTASIMLCKNLSPDNHILEKNIVHGRLLHAKRQILGK